MNLTQRLKKMKNSSIILAQGYKYIITIFIIAIITSLLDLEVISAILYVATIFALFVFKNPNRVIFKNENSVLSPIDGRVSAIDFVDGNKKIYCKVTPCDTHVVRAPSDTNIKIKNHKNGLNLNPSSYKASILNETITFIFPNIELKLISGICNPKINYTEDSNALQGEPITMFIDGLAVITVDDSVNLDVNIGDKLTAGQSVLFTK